MSGLRQKVNQNESYDLLLWQYCQCKTEIELIAFKCLVQASPLPVTLIITTRTASYNT